MIICKAPLRVSFLGGGSDFDYFIQKNKFGATLSCTINKFIYVVFFSKKEKNYKINYSKQESVKKINKIKHRHIRLAFKYFNIKKGIELSSFAEIKSGIGLSSSSAFDSALILGLEKLNKNQGKRDIWKRVHYFENEIIKNYTGYQDQYIINNGGIRFTKYFKNKKTISKKIIINKKIISFFKNNLILIDTGIKRNYRLVHNDQKLNKGKNNKNLLLLRNNAKKGYGLLKKFEFKKFAQLLQKSWELKKSLSKEIFKNIKLKRLEEKLKINGFWGLKLLGMGGGGIILALGTKNYINKIKKLKKYRSYSILPTTDKAKIIYSE